MKTTKIVLLLGMFLGVFHALQGQVKIGDNVLNIGANRMYEIETLNEFFIFTDSLQMGRSTSANGNNPNTDALMLKLYGYGLGNFTGTQDFFLGTNNTGEVLEFPLSLNLVATSSSLDLSLNNGTSLFGNVDLLPLDSIFATDLDVINIVNASANADGDTLTGNEWIDEMTLTPTSEVRLTIFEDILGPDSTRNAKYIDLGFILARKIDVADTILQVRNELADTAQALRDQIFYKIDGSLDENRTLTGLNYNLTFTDLDSFTVSANNVTVNGTGTTSITSTDDINLTSSSGAVNIDGSTSGVNVTGAVNFGDYGGGPVPGTETNILGVTASGQVIEVSLDSIGGDATLSGPVDLDDNGTLEYTVDEAIQASNLDPDSTIYEYNGTLTSERTMLMDGNNLFFVGSGGDTIMFGDGGVMAIGKSAPLNGTTNGIRLDVNGDILAMQVHSSSDRRFKKNIVPLESALDKVKAINGVTYDFRIDEFENRNFPTTRQVGFIAQNVEEVLPEVVRTNADGYKAVDYSKITALLNEAVKEQQLQIEQQSALINAQQNLLSTLLSNQASMSQELSEVKTALQNVSNQTMSEE